MLILISCALVISAQNVSLREMVVIVKPNYYDGTIKFLKEYSKTLKREGYYDASEVLNAYAEGGFGSGFIYKNAANGKFYVVTNRHVLSQAKDVNIEIFDEEETKIKLENCTIIAVDEMLDLGIVELPASANIKSGLTLSNTNVNDADEVFTAGFPGLGKNPSWQLGKGIVSNAKLQSDELTNGSPTRIIQHTAQVDAGSSGGPLLVRDSNAPGGFLVVGINTWKAEGRENANFAIPASAILKFIDNYVVNEKELNEEMLRSKVNDFITAGKQGFSKVLPFISYQYIDNITVNNFYDLVNSSSDKAVDAMKEQFVNGYPIEGVRIAIADAIVRMLEKKSLSFVSIDNFTDNSQPVNVVLSSNGVNTNSVWNGERGTWQISDFSLLNLNNLGKKGIATDFGYTTSIKIGTDIPLKSHEGIRYSLSVERTVYTFMTYGFNFHYGSSEYIQSDYDYAEHRYDTTYVSKNYAGLDLSLGGQLPVKVGQIYLIPRLQGFYGLDFGGENLGGMYYGYSLGVEAAYKLQRKTYLFVGTSYKHKLSPKFFSEDSSRVNPSGVPYLKLYVGISF